MKTTLVILLFATACLAVSFTDNKLVGRQHKRDSDPLVVCDYQLSCSPVGGSCSTIECPDCMNPLNECLAKGRTCDCYDNFFACVANKHDLLCDLGAFVPGFECAFSNLNCTCAFPNTTATNVSESYALCPADAYCSDTTAKCATHKSVGQTCNSTVECGPTADSLFGSYECINNKCAYATAALPGDPCTKDSDCEFYGNYSLGCVSGVCASQQVGKDCPYTTAYGYTCGYGLYCQSNSTCQKQVALGGSCSESDDSPCQGLAVCGSGSTCVKIFSKSAGQSCKIGDECGSGLYCSVTKGVCTSMTGLPTISCNSTSDCSGDQSDCGCQDRKSVCQVPDDMTPEMAVCIDSFSAYEQCIASNGCSTELTANGCIQTHCSDEVQCVYACSIKNNNVYGSAYAACLPNVSCSETSGALKNVASLAAIAGATALLL